MYGLIDDDAPDFKPCERTVKAILAALPADSYTVQAGSAEMYREQAIRECKARVAAFLDPAKAMMEEIAGENAAMSREFADGAYWAIKHLIDTGRIRSGE